MLTILVMTLFPVVTLCSMGTELPGKNFSLSKTPRKNFSVRNTSGQNSYGKGIRKFHKGWEVPIVRSQGVR
jgi:hypothetical protein